MIIFYSDNEAPPPPPPSRSASIRPEPSLANNNPRPPRPCPRPHQKDGNTDSSNQEPSTSVAALRQAVFGDKKSGPPPVLQKSTIKTAQKRREDHSTEPATNTTAKKSSVLKIAAALESSKHDVSSSGEDEPEAVVDVPTPKTAPPFGTQTQERNVDKLSSLNQQSDDGSFPPGAPYEVPKQGNVHQLRSRISNNTPYTGNKKQNGNDSFQQRRSGADQPPQSENQSSLADSLQAALARRAVNKEQNKSQNVSHSQAGLRKHAHTEDNQSLRKSPADSVHDNISEQSQTPLLERIRQRKAQRDNNGSPSDDKTSANAVTAEHTHSIKPSLPDPPAETNSRKSQHSSLRRSSSNVSCRRISDENPLDVENSMPSRQKGLHRSPSNASRRLNNVSIPNPPSGFNNDANLQTRLQRTPSNKSRRSSEEGVPQLPPRSKTQMDSKKKDINQSQSKLEQSSIHNTDGGPTEMMSSNQHVGNSTGSSVEESMVLADFISRYSGALPLAVSIQDSACVSSKRLVSTAQCNSFNVHFVKHSKVVIIHDLFGGESFSVPLNSCVKFGLIYDQNQRSEIAASTDHARYFENAGDIISFKKLPYVICATKNFDGGSQEKSVAAGEVLFVRGVKKPKAIGRGKVLKVNSINGEEKLLGSKCSGGFTTSPQECQLSLAVLMEHLIPFPQHALIFSGAQVTSYLPKTMIDHPVILEKIHGESSAIMTPRYDMNETENESWMYDVKTEVKLWVKKLPLSKQKRDELNANTNILHTTFDPLYTQHYADKSDDNGIALQHVFFVNIQPGKEKEGVHLYLPSAGMMQQDMNQISEGPKADEDDQNSTYALHITEQRNTSKRNSGETATGQCRESTNYILPTEDSDVDLEDVDEPEEAYEEVMTALGNIQEEQIEPTEAKKIGKIAGMFKSVKQSLAKMHKDEMGVSEDDAAIETASTTPEPDEDYDSISFKGDASEEEEDQQDVPPPLPDISQITRRRPPQMAPPQAPFEQVSSGPPSIAIQRLMAAAKVSAANVDTSNEPKEEPEKEGYQPVSVGDEMFEDDESGYSDVRSLNIPSIIAARQSSIASTLSKRKPPLPPPAKEETPALDLLKSKRSSNSSLPASDKADSQDETVQQSAMPSSSGGSVEGDYVRLRGLYSGLQTQMTQMMDEMNQMKLQIEELSHTVEELVQFKDIKQDSLHPSKTRTLPRSKKTKIK